MAHSLFPVHLDQLLQQVIEPRRLCICVVAGDQSRLLLPFRVKLLLQDRNFAAEWGETQLPFLLVGGNAFFKE